MINWDESWQAISKLLPPYFFGTLAAAAFGAFAGAWINNRIQTSKFAVEEMNNLSAALLLCMSICNTAIGLKRQHVGPMRDAYNRQHQSYEKSRRKVPRPPFVLQADLQTLAQPKMPAELMEKRIEKISIQGRALAAAVQLNSSIDSLGRAIKDRNELIVEIREAKLDQQSLLERYLGLRSANGVIDSRFNANIKGIFDQTNDCVMFSVILSEDLLTYGKKLRRKHMWRLRFGLPQLDGADFSRAESEGLIPPRSDYEAWLSGFKRRPSLRERVKRLFAFRKGSERIKFLKFR